MGFKCEWFKCDWCSLLPCTILDKVAYCDELRAGTTYVLYKPAVHASRPLIFSGAWAYDDSNFRVFFIEPNKSIYNLTMLDSCMIF